MHRITRVLASLTAAAAAVTMTACGSDPDETTSATGVHATPSEMTTTRSAPVPGPDGGTVDIPAPVAERWDQLGGPAGGLGPATGPAQEVAGGSVTDFEGGSIVLDPTGRAFVVQGEILDAYRDAGGPAGELGFPTSDETTTDGGWISTFQGGAITFLDGEVSVENT